MKLEIRTIALVLLVAVPGSASGDGIRSRGPVIVPGSQLAPLVGVSVDLVRVLAVRDGTHVPIPFQVDERKPDGEWAYADGVEATADPDEALDADDEVVFMAADVGTRSTREPPGCRRSVEVQIADPVEGGRSWVYVCEAVSAAGARANEEYLELDTTTDTVDTPFYSVTFSHSLPSSYAFVGLRRPDGSTGLNVIDRTKIRVKAHLLLGLIEWATNEDDMQSRPVGYLAGPVRVIRRVRSVVKLGLGIESPTFRQDTTFYPDSAIVLGPFDVPFEPGALVQGFDSYAYADFRRAGWKLYTSRNPDPVTVDGSMSAVEEALDRGDTEWIVGFDPARVPGPAVLVRMVLSEGMRGVDRELHYLDAEDIDDEPEVVRGQHSVGYRFQAFENISKGTHTIDMRYELLRDFRPGDEAVLLEYVRRPLEIRGASR